MGHSIYRAVGHDPRVGRDYTFVGSTRIDFKTYINNFAYNANIKYIRIPWDTHQLCKKKKKHMFDYWFGCQKKVKLLKISQTGGNL